MTSLHFTPTAAATPILAPNAHWTLHIWSLASIKTGVTFCGKMRQQGALKKKIVINCRWARVEENTYEMSEATCHYGILWTGFCQYVMCGELNGTERCVECPLVVGCGDWVCVVCLQGQMESAAPVATTCCKGLFFRAFFCGSSVGWVL